MKKHCLGENEIIIISRYMLDISAASDY